MDRATTALLTGGMSEMFGGGGGLFGGGDSGGDNDALEAMLYLIQQNTKKAEKEYKPYISGGQSAQEQMMAQLGLGGPAKAFDVTKLPGYQNALKQGLSAVNQGGAGAGMLMSGDRLKGLQDVGQNIFGDYYNNYLNRLTGMAQTGYGAVGNLSNIRTGGVSQQVGLMQQDEMQQQQQKADQKGDMLGLLGTGLGFMVGGPMGAAAGGGLGQMAGGGGGGMDFNLSSMYAGL